MNRNKCIEVVIVDDHPVVLQGFAYMLQDLEGVCHKASFETAAAAIAYLKEGNKTDVVLLDINLPDMNGIDACAEIKRDHPDLKVIAISNINEHSIIQRMLDAGAVGYLLKNASSDELSSCIQSALVGVPALSAGVEAILASHKNGLVPTVTRREKEVLVLLAEGLSSSEIGEKIFISPLTVESHRRNLLAKFKVNNVAALVHKATEMKYI